MADDTNTAGLKALQEYLKDCDAHAIVPDVGGAWHAAFQAGRASLAASAGSEPVAVAEVSCTHVHGWGTRWIVDADRKLNIPPLGTKLYARPPAPKQGQKDSSRLRKALIRAQQAINSMKVEAETAAQGDKRMMLEACETISNEGLQADMAIRDALANHPSPPEGMAGWMPIETAPKDEMYRDGPNAYAEYILVWYPGAIAPIRARWWQSDSGRCNFWPMAATRYFRLCGCPCPPHPLPHLRQKSCDG